MIYNLPQDFSNVLKIDSFLDYYKCRNNLYEVLSAQISKGIPFQQLYINNLAISPFPTAYI